MKTDKKTKPDKIFWFFPQDDDEVVDLAPAAPRTEEEEAEVNQLSLELNFARADFASLLNHDDDDD